jgi:esterase/lipase
MVHSRNDETVPFSDAEKIIEKLGSRDKQLLPLEECGHVLPLDAEREILYQAAERFIQAHAGKIE